MSSPLPASGRLRLDELLVSRGLFASRSRARDYYDLWRVLSVYQDRMDLSDFRSFLREKCAVRGVAFGGPGDFFQEAMLTHVETTWNQWLGPLVPSLPSFRTVIDSLRPQVVELLRSEE